MTKKIIIPKSIEQIKRLSPYIDGVLVGIKDYSSNFEETYTVEEINKIIQVSRDKDVFVAVNKNIFNHELKGVEEVLVNLNKLAIKGVLFYDLAILNLKNKLHLKYDLVWAQEHFTTNYATANYYYNEGSVGMLISSDITKEEILDIKKNTKAYVMVTLFGYLPIFTSYRHLIDNYKKTFKLEDHSDKYYMTKENKKYRIVDDCYGTYVYSAHIVNGTEEYAEMQENNLDYIILNAFDIETDIFEKVVCLWNTVTKENGKEIREKIDTLCENKTDKGFLYKETIYKVKRS